ncbi:HAL/PAL/TAL family ammonia-lyase [Sporomusa termitida]|uniref:Histidine ammonia-lyase n=1 Tax=Sporomusa termitida TaxID=2377 RepID=A0A517DPI5_9FIRM|nr:aromatic amino acid ammonia-lyase [Sporomusa termitida]QDR79281.1 Histidine ammonia-lyase [Sporomusa termitida]
MSRLCSENCNQAEIVLTGNDLTIKQVVEAARRKSSITIAAEAMETVKKSRKIVMRLANQERLFYGVNTGTGANKTIRIPNNELEMFQRRIILSHCICVEKPAEEDVIRAAMVVRINGMLKGTAGVNPEIIELFTKMLNRRIHPVVPLVGSVGDSDIGPLAHFVLPLLGMGEVIYKGIRTSSVEAFAAENLQPIVLGPKDGLGIINSNAVYIGAGALVLSDCKELFDLSDVSYALNLEAFQGNTSPLRPESFDMRPHVGQRKCAERIRNILENSFLWQPDQVPRTVQDPISYRSTPQVHGACREALEFATSILAIELNSMSDNPMVLIDKCDMISNGQFHILNVTHSFELLRIALANLANTICSRMFRLMDPVLSGLPAFLSPTPGRCCGYAALQKTIADLNSQIRQLAHPVSMDYLPLGRDVEDICTMAPLAIKKTAESLGKLEYLIAIEFMVACQAVDLRSNLPLGRGTQLVYQRIRKVVPFLEEDRVVANDVQTVYDLVSKRIINKDLAAIVE